VTMDPLSEEAHRQLLRLYGLAGERGHALAHYRELRVMLGRELGLEPLPETTALYQEILADTLARSVSGSARRSPRPIVPLVGRGAALEILDECWSSVLDGGGRMTVVEGEAGVGKSRLVRSFLDKSTRHRDSGVLQARCIDQSPRPPLGVVVEVLRQLFSDLPDRVWSWAGALPGPARSGLALLLPEITALHPELANRAPALPQGAGPVDAVADLLARLPAIGDGRPIVLFLDDVHWADPATLELLGILPRHIAEQPLWVVVTLSPGPHASSAWAERLLETEEGDRVVRRVALHRLGEGELGAIARTLVGEADAEFLAAFLRSVGAGLPLAVVALVNVLWDEGLLKPRETGGAEPRWLLAPAREWPSRWPDSVEELVQMRLRRLPSSTRRLASLAAAVGAGFDARLLCEAEHEHRAVVEVGLEILLDHWFIRQSGLPWSRDGLESGVGLWSMGARDGQFDFDHDLVRRAVYESLNPLRRGVLHGQIARALEAREGGRSDEAIASHALAAGDLELACVALLRSAERAVQFHLLGVARERCVTTLDLAGRMRAQAAAGEADALGAFEARAGELLERLDTLSSVIA
jgi:hypothetical protein